MIRRRRPLLRAAMIGGVGSATYQAGRRGAEQRPHEYQEDARLADPPQQAAPPPAMPAADRLETLTRLEALLDSGALTQEEFDAEKRRVLAT